MPFIKGYKPTEEHRKKQSEARRKLPSNTKGKHYNKKENHPKWKGGIAKDKAHWRRIFRNRRLNITGFHTTGEWETLKKQYNFACPCCKKSEPEIILTEDHIIPVTKGGSDNIENIQPLCRSCNSRKYTKIIKYNYH